MSNGRNNDDDEGNKNKDVNERQPTVREQRTERKDRPSLVYRGGAY